MVGLGWRSGTRPRQSEPHLPRGVSDVAARWISGIGNHRFVILSRTLRIYNAAFDCLLASLLCAEANARTQPNVQVLM